MSVVTYDKPQGAPDSGWQVYADFRPTWTHHTSRGATATISSDGAARVPIIIVAPETVHDVEIACEQPEVWPSPEITGIFFGRVLAFIVPEDFQGNLLVRINNAQGPDWQKFCSLGILPLETDVPNEGDVTHYFGPGVHTGGTIGLGSGESVYVAGGAYLNRRIVAGDFNGQPHQVNDLRIYGRGVIDTTDGYGPTDLGMGAADLCGVDGLRIEGISYVGRYHWGIATYLCSDVVGDWIRLYSCEIPDAPEYTAQGTPDGWDFIGCSNVVLMNSLLSASDDSSAAKGDKYGQIGDNNNITYKDILLMQGGKSNGFDIGYELGTTTTTNTTYLRIVQAVCYRDEQPYRTAPLGIHLPSKATVDGVLYEDIDVKEIDEKDYALFIGTWYSSSLSYSQPGAENRGTIKNVTLRRVHWPATDRIVKISSEGGRIGPIVFEDCTWGGQPLTAAKSGWEITNADVSFVITPTDPDPEPSDLEQRVSDLEDTVSVLQLNQQTAATHLHQAAAALENNE